MKSEISKDIIIFMSDLIINSALPAVLGCAMLIGLLFYMICLHREGDSTILELNLPCFI